MKRLFCIWLCVALLCSWVAAVDVEDVKDAEELFTEFMQANGLDETNFAVSYFNTSTGESYHFNHKTFLPSGDVWTLPLHMYYCEQDSLGAFKPPLERPNEIFTINGLTLSECRYENIINGNQEVAKTMREQVGLFRQYQLTINEAFGHCAEASLPDVFFSDTYYSTEFFINCLKDWARQPEIYKDLWTNYAIVQRDTGLGGADLDYNMVHIYDWKDSWACDIARVSAPQPYLVSCFISMEKINLLAELNQLLCKYAEISSDNLTVMHGDRGNLRKDKDFEVLNNIEEHRSNMVHWMWIAVAVFAVVVAIVWIAVWTTRRRKQESHLL